MFTWLCYHMNLATLRQSVVLDTFVWDKQTDKQTQTTTKILSPSSRQLREGKDWRRTQWEEVKTNVKHGQQYSTGGENTESTAGKGMKEEEYMQEKCEKIEEGQEKKNNEERGGKGKC